MVKYTNILARDTCKRKALTQLFYDLDKDFDVPLWGRALTAAFRSFSSTEQLGYMFGMLFKIKKNYIRYAEALFHKVVKLLLPSLRSDSKNVLHISRTG